MIVKNEERFLEQCLRSAAGVADEICIVDTGSTDATLEIAERFGARIEHRPWRNDFAWARNESLALATKRWILVLDADEELLPESLAALEELKRAPAYRTAVWLRCFNKADDYRGTGTMSHALIRIFPNSDEIRFRGLIHEFPTVGDSPTGLDGVTSPVAILHHGYLKDVVSARDKGRRNLEIVTAATEREPDDPFHWFNLGSTAFLMGDFEAARDALERMRDLNGRRARGFVPNGLAMLSEVYGDKLRDPERGAQTARLCLEFSPHYANGHFQLGKSLVALARLDEAREAYAAAIDDGNYAQQQFVVDEEVSIWKAQSEIGSTYAQQGDFQQALEWFEKGLANRPKVQPLRVNYARALEQLGRFGDALRALRELYEEFGDEQAILDYTNFLLRHGEESRAIEVIERSYRRTAKTTAVTMLTAAAAVAQRRGWLAPERYLEMALEIEPGAAAALNALEALYRERGEDAKLEALLERERATAPAESADFLRRSHQHIGAGTFVSGLDLALQGLARWPEDPLLHYNAAICLVNLGRKDEAIEHLGRIGEGATPAYGRARFLEGVILRELGRFDEALACVDRLLRIDPVQLDAQLLRAALLEAKGLLGEAEAALQGAVSLDRQRASVELATFYLRTGRFDDARRVADGALA